MPRTTPTIVTVIVLVATLAGCIGSHSSSLKATTTAPPVLLGARLPIALHGVGLQDSKIFSATRPWQIHWSYDCGNITGSGDPDQQKQGDKKKESHAGTGTFGLVLIGTGSTTGHSYPVKRRGRDGKGVLDERKTGSFILRVLTDCSWHARVQSS